MRVLVIIAILIAYGSLYPGNFSSPDPGDVTSFLTDWSWFTSRGDLLGNIALFFPLGMAGSLVARQNVNTRSRILATFFLALVFSFVLQFAQLWLPSRSAAMADIAWNMVGMAIGIAAEILIRDRAGTWEASFGPVSLATLSILILWLLSELLPLVPTLDWQKFKDAFKPLSEGNPVSIPAAMKHATGVIVAGSALTDRGRRGVTYLAGGIVLIVAGKIAVVGLALTPSTLIGLIAGYIVFLALSHSSPKSVFEFAFLLLFSSWSITAVTPFTPASGGSFNSIPFAAMLDGSMEVGARALAESLFIYTALLWLVQQTEMDLRKATAGLLTWLCLLELVQMSLLGRTADITELILFVLVACVLSTMRRVVRPALQIPSARASQAAPSIAIHARISGKRALGLIMIGITLLAVAGRLITLSPLTPYNVRELVYEGHPARSLILLAALLYWAIGFPIIVARWMARGKLFLLSLPPLVLLHGLIAWLLLWSSVPSESIHDIVGSPILGWPWEWESLGRFLALFSLWSTAATVGSILGAWRVIRGRWPALFGWIMGTCLLVPVSYYCVVTVAATDNLTELIAGHAGFGAFLLIGLALAVMVFGGTKGALALIPGTPGRFQAAAWILGSGVLAYAALYLGTEQIILKYGQVYSALQFLLSSERSNLIAEHALFIRYTVLYFFITAAIVTIQYPLWSWTMSETAQCDEQPLPLRN